MKILQEFNQTKPVKYFGLYLNVPYTANYIATDEDGMVWCYDNKPEINKFYSDCWTYRGYDNNFIEIAEVDLEGMDWKDTLMEIK